jgi:hypothetical protein
VTQGTVRSFFTQLVAILIVLSTLVGLPRQIDPAPTTCAWCPAQEELTSVAALSLSAAAEDAPLSAADGPRDSEEKQDHEEERSEGKLLALPRDAWNNASTDRLLTLLSPDAIGLSAGRAASIMVFRPPC